MMSFADLAREAISCKNALERADQSLRRKWRVRLGDNTVKDGMIDVGLTIEVFPKSYTCPTSSAVKVALFVRAWPAHAGGDPRPIEVLRAHDLAALAHARNIVDDYMHGKLDELPIETPESIVLITRTWSEVSP